MKFNQSGTWHFPISCWLWRHHEYINRGRQQDNHQSSVDHRLSSPHSWFPRQPILPGGGGSFTAGCRNAWKLDAQSSLTVPMTAQSTLGVWMGGRILSVLVWVWECLRGFLFRSLWFSSADGGGERISCREGQSPFFPERQRERALLLPFFAPSRLPPQPTAAVHGTRSSSGPGVCHWDFKQLKHFSFTLFSSFISLSLSGSQSFYPFSSVAAAAELFAAFSLFLYSAPSLWASFLSLCVSCAPFLLCTVTLQDILRLNILHTQTHSQAVCRSTY